MTAVRSMDSKSRDADMAKTVSTIKALKAPRRPHNASKSPRYRSIGELARTIAAEPRRASMGGEEVVMTAAERLCRLTVENAINGSIGDLKLIIQLMIDHPHIASSARECWVLLLAGDDARL